MHHRAKDITGKRSHFLTAEEYAGSDGKKSLTTLLYRLNKGVPANLLFQPPDVTNRFTTS